MKRQRQSVRNMQVTFTKYSGYDLLVIQIYSESSERDPSEATQVPLQKHYGEHFHGRMRRHA
jgi:hypothetical protein